MCIRDRWEPDFSDMWMKEFYEKWLTVPYSQEKEEYQNHPENFGSSLIGIDEQEFDFLNKNLEQPINKEEFLSGKTCIIYRNGLDLSNSDLIGSKVTCALHSDKQVTQTFTIGGVTDESYYTAILGYPPTIKMCIRDRYCYCRLHLESKVSCLPARSRMVLQVCLLSYLCLDNLRKCRQKDRQIKRLLYNKMGIHRKMKPVGTHF